MIPDLKSLIEASTKIQAEMMGVAGMEVQKEKTPEELQAVLQGWLDKHDPTNASAVLAQAITRSYFWIIEAKGIDPMEALPSCIQTAFIQGWEMRGVFKPERKGKK